MPIEAVAGAGREAYESSVDDGGRLSVYKAVFVVVDKGKGGNVMDVAKEVVPGWNHHKRRGLHS